MHFESESSSKKNWPKWINLKRGWKLAEKSVIISFPFPLCFPSNQLLVMLNFASNEFWSKIVFLKHPRLYYDYISIPILPKQCIVCQDIKWTKQRFWWASFITPTNDHRHLKFLVFSKAVSDIMIDLKINKYDKSFRTSNLKS